MTVARWVARIAPAIWSVIVLVEAVTGVTATQPRTWAPALLILVFFTVAARRFLIPSLAIAPSPAAPLCALAALAVAVRAGWLDGPWTAVLGSSATWVPLLLCVVAISTAVVAPYTGVRSTISEPMRFPLREGRWLVVEGNGRILNHHWVAPAQRGALDLVRLGILGRSRHGFSGNGDDEFHAFGVEILAPCDGVVVAAIDGLPDGALDTRQPAGNHVLIDTGNERVILAHMRRGTVAVTAGDAVRRSDRIGEVGNSGNSSEPHLHIHAERDGRPLRLRFDDARGRFAKGDVVRTGGSTVAV